ncbi:uncharacterized protein LOC111630082 [Centruroides sculpturatus]|uniref:uncharacterized protein LOC111630082 n=1 Tax=Centruroides sculpturatus TaxID=218467 RepID=UPI000C6DC262|nr:uncharacterized protein LOC111630082 [Centruroides sculpturatus]
MESAQKGFEFLDFSNIAEDEVKEIRELLNPANGVTVELPWELTPDEVSPETTVTETDDNVVNSEAEPETELVQVATEQMIYTSTHYPFVANVSHPGMMAINPAFVTPPAISVTNVNHFANPQPYFLPRTAIPYLRAYAQVGVPLITLPQQGAQDVTVIPQPPYHTLTPVPNPVVKVEPEAISEGRQKIRNHNDKQYVRRGRKKLLANNSYSTEVSNAIDPYHQGTIMAETTTIHSDTGGEHLPPSMTHTPLVPFSAFAVTGGALHIAAPTPGYHPGITPLPYSHLPSPQTPSTPVFYVPVYNPPYGYIQQPTSGQPVLTTIPAGMPCTPNGCGTMTGESLDACSDAQNDVIQTANQKNVSIRELNDNGDEHKKKSSVSEDGKMDANIPSEEGTSPVYSEQTGVGQDTPTDRLTNDISRLNLNENDMKGNLSLQENGGSLTSDISHRSWADLFRNEEEMMDAINGMDHPSETSTGEIINCETSRINKIKNSNSLPHEDELANSEKETD